MGILRVDHPDIEDFILMKKDGKSVGNFNISVAVTDAFMDAVKNGDRATTSSTRTSEEGRRPEGRPQDLPR